MLQNCEDTVAAIGTPQAGALRGMIRVSGPDAVACLSRCFAAEDSQYDWQSLRTPQRIRGTIHPEWKVPCDLYLWPTVRSYTRQPSGEIHTIGSPPLLDAILQQLCQHGARLAEPGEFTLRAFLAGRIDLTQAEAVLGVIDARGESDFETALQQLAGGISKPLTEIRERLLALVAELEAGLDFVEEDIEFISREQISNQLTEALTKVTEVRAQMEVRNVTASFPRVVLTGLPNAGKSSLFNALVERHGCESEQAGAIVSEQPGTTRDYLSATIDLDGITCELVDTAGRESDATEGSISQAAQEMTSTQHLHADLEILCVDISADPTFKAPQKQGSLEVITKGDLLENQTSDGLSCSSKTGDGLEELCRTASSLLSSGSQGQVVFPTALRCAESLNAAEACLDRARRLAGTGDGDELVATEVRAALSEIGQVVGVVYTDDILDRIFGQFCIGK